MLRVNDETDIAGMIEGRGYYGCKSRGNGECGDGMRMMGGWGGMGWDGRCDENDGMRRMG